MPFSPGTRPKLTVPSASRGVGSCGPRPRPRPPPPCRRQLRRCRRLRGRPGLRLLLRRSPAPTPVESKHRCGSRAHQRGAEAVGHGTFGPLEPDATLTAWCPGSTPAKRRLTGRLEDNGARVAGRAAVLRQAAFDRHPFTDLHRVARPALAHQAVRAAHLHRPVGDLLRLLIDHVDIEEGVGIHPLDLGDGARHLERLVRVELRRERVVRESPTRGRKQHGRGHDDKKLRSHSNNPPDDRVCPSTLLARYYRRMSCTQRLTSAACPTRR